MEEKKYPTSEEENMVASDPIGQSVSTYRPIHEEADTIPYGIPHTYQEALKDLEEGELEFERGETVSHSEVMKAVWNKIEHYAG